MFKNDTIELKIHNKLAPFNPSNNQVIEIALDMLKPNSKDILYDIGCGDGRVLTTAAMKYMIKCVGVEYDQKYVDRAKTRIQQENLQGLVTIVHKDALLVNYSEATIIFMYLVPEGLKQIMPKLEEARKRGARIVTYMFSLPQYSPTYIKSFKGTKIEPYKSNSSRIVIIKTVKDTISRRNIPGIIKSLKKYLYHDQDNNP